MESIQQPPTGSTLVCHSTKWPTVCCAPVPARSVCNLFAAAALAVALNYLSIYLRMLTIRGALYCAIQLGPTRGPVQALLIIIMTIIMKLACLTIVSA